MNRRKKSLVDRFLAKVAKPENPKDCWLWTGCKGGGGYGWFNSTAAHRTSWEIYVGKIPDGLQVLHKCDVRKCVNPSHLFLGTPQDNMKDMKQKGRSRNMYSGKPKIVRKVAYSARIRTELAEELTKATSGLYAPSMTAIIERGIELALRELKTKKTVAVQQ